MTELLDQMLRMVDDHRRHLGHTPPELEEARWYEFKLHIASALHEKICSTTRVHRAPCDGILPCCGIDLAHLPQSEAVTVAGVVTCLGG